MRHDHLQPGPACSLCVVVWCELREHVCVLLDGVGVVAGGKDSRFAVGFSIPLVAMVLAVLVVSHPSALTPSLTDQASL